MNYYEQFKAQVAYYKLGYTKSITFREMMLKRLLKAVKAYRKDIFKALEFDLNKHYFESYVSELFLVEKSIKYTIKNLAKWSKDKKVKRPFYLMFSKSYVRNIPYGNALILNAYNYPLLLSLDPLIGAIAAGNTVMLGLSKKSSATNKVIIEMLNTTFDNDYIFVFETDRYINKALLTYKFDKVFFTGSAKVGKAILAETSKQLISTTLELGGKSPAIVSKNANIKNSAESIMYAKVLNAGQTCIAVDYVLVDRLVATELISEFKKSLAKLYPTYADYPKIIDESSYERLKHLVALDKEYIINEYVANSDQLSLSPVLLKVDIQSAFDLASMETEIFGPILPIIVYDDLATAIAFVNKLEVPLAFYPFSQEKVEIDYMLENIEFGGSTINDTLLHFSNYYLPFSGFKDSGMLSYHGKYSFETFSYQQPLLYKSKFFGNKFIFGSYKKIFKQ